MKKRQHDAVRWGLAFNLATGAATSVLALIDAVAAACGRRVPVLRAARRPGDPPMLYAKAELAAQVPDWRPLFVDIGPIVKTATLWLRKAAAR